MTTRKVSEIVWREDLYPRIKADSAVIQRYAENLEVLPPVEINQHNELIDGYHRWTAHKLDKATDIAVTITKTVSDVELLALACQRNAAHGLQLTDPDKRKMAIRLYNAGTGLSKEDISKTLSVTPRSVSSYLSEIDKHLKEERKQKIFDMWLACYTDKEIGEAVGLSTDAIEDETRVIRDLEALPKSGKLATLYNDAFEPPLYNVWTFAKKTNEVSHFGNSEQRIVDNLLYLYTQPFDIVLDPFAGGGSTIDVCQKRMRRYWCSDRKPTEARQDIRTLDIAQDLPPMNKRWSDMALTYLDPPYWRQAQGKYSKDTEDLANMPLDLFRSTLTGIVKRIAAKQSKGVIALLMQPTQWSADERQFTDHIAHLLQDIKLPIENRISCPYSTEQYNPQQVTWAKENKKLLVITRELIVWRIQ